MGVSDGCYFSVNRTGNSVIGSKSAVDSWNSLKIGMIDLIFSKDYIVLFQQFGSMEKKSLDPPSELSDLCFCANLFVALL